MYGHTKRMPGDRIPKMMMEWEVDWRKKKKGRPKECWMDGVKKSMNEKGLTEEDVNDRNYWRQTIS